MKIRAGQKGFTALELIVAVGVGAIVLTGVVVAIFQTFGVTTMTTSDISALDNIKNTAYEMTVDIKQASTCNLVTNAQPVNNLTLDWTIWFTSGGDPIGSGFGEYHRCKYYLDGTNLLRRTGLYTPTSQPTLPIPDSSFTWQPEAQIKRVARYITEMGLSRDASNIITIHLTASASNQADETETKTYYVLIQTKEAPLP
jgi:prepilin-type N-terminal cleavage/methylation domain-containing protein